MTPREYWRELEAAAERSRQELRRDLFLAWQSASFIGAAFVGKLPAFAQVLARFQTVAEPLNPAQLRTQVAILSEKLGVPVLPLSEASKRALLKLGKEQRGG